jgi:hypothetical protein
MLAVPRAPRRGRALIGAQRRSGPSGGSATDSPPPWRERPREAAKARFSAARSSGSVARDAARARMSRAPSRSHDPSVAIAASRCAGSSPQRPCWRATSSCGWNRPDLARALPARKGSPARSGDATAAGARRTRPGPPAHRAARSVRAPGSARGATALPTDGVVSSRRAITSQIRTTGSRARRTPRRRARRLQRRATVSVPGARPRRPCPRGHRLG